MEYERDIEWPNQGKVNLFIVKPKNETKITFKKLSKEDMPLFLEWAKMPHVKNTWFQDGYEAIDKYDEKINGNGYDYGFIIYLNEKPVGYIQTSDLYAYKTKCTSLKGVFTNEEPGTFCLDLFIAEEDYLNKGYGTKIVKAFVDKLFKEFKAKKILIDPSSENKRAIRCYEKAGFKIIRKEHDGVNECCIMEKSTVLFESDTQKEYFDQTFKGLDLSGKTIGSKIFENCKFDQCNFSETDFQKCRFCDCEFEHCNLSLIKIKGCSFSNVKFVDSKIAGVNWTEGAWPKIKLLCPIHFTKCDISHSTFFGMNLREASIIECRANNVDFREADLTKADLTYSDFAESLFINTNLTEADFSYAENYRVDVTTNKTTKAKFMLPEAIALLYGLDIELVDSN